MPDVRKTYRKRIAVSKTGNDLLSEFFKQIDIVKKFYYGTQNLEEAIILRKGIPAHFEWAKGHVPEIPEIKKVVKPKTVPVDIYTLIKKL
jgi:hypothetical protein